MSTAVETSTAVEQTGFILDSPESYLGPAETRYFGHGYKRIRQNVTVTEVTTNGSTWSLGASCAVEYPADWSTKATGAQRPHLSTTDIVLVAVRVAATLTALARNLTDRELADAWVRQVAVRSAGRPVESGFDALPVTAELVTLRPSAGDHADTVTEVTIGSFSATVTVSGATVGSAPAGAGVADAQALLDPDRPSPYDDGYRRHTGSTRALEIDPVAHRVDAVSSVHTSAGDGVDPTGLGASYEPSATMIDVFVEALQLGQILMYELDGLDRATSNTLWMRRTVLTAAEPNQSVAEVPVSVHLSNNRVVTRRDSTWRACDIVAERAGISLVCSVTHEISTVDRASS